MDSRDGERGGRYVLVARQPKPLTNLTLDIILDLDSIASSLAYAWFLSSVRHERAVPLIQISREDLHLRPENVHAFTLAGFSTDQRELLCIDDEELDKRSPFPSDHFALVDHNHLLSKFEEGNNFVRVVAILDHHEDEGLYKDTANPREIVVPLGSSASLITRYVRSQITEGKAKLPPELATLLFCAILLDTNGLKEGGKAERLDYESAAYLLEHSSLTSLDEASVLSMQTNPLILANNVAVNNLSFELLQKKADVSHLLSFDLLRRDYKQYSWLPSSGTGEQKSVSVGLATVPVGLKEWLSRDNGRTEFWEATDRFMRSRHLDALGILTSFRGQNSGKHKRQLVFVVRAGAIDAALEKKLRSGLENSKDLKLEAKPTYHYTGDDDDSDEDKSDLGARGLSARMYKQHNSKATRKVVAPLLKAICEGESG